MQKDIKIYYISNPEQDNNTQLVFSIRSKNKFGYKYYIMDLPNDKNNKLELKRIDNAMLLLSEIISRPISLEKEKDEFITAIALLELAIKEAQSQSITLTEMLDNQDTLDKIKFQRKKINTYTSSINPIDTQTIKSIIKK